MAEENDKILEREETLEDSAIPQPVSNLPFIITLVALTIYFVFQTLQLATGKLKDVEPALARRSTVPPPS